MHPFVPLDRTPAVAAGQALLIAASSLGREEQPRLYRHVHPHGHATARLARSFAAAIGGAGAATPDEIELGAHLHDFGKYLIAESILLKPGPLNAAERAAVSLHPVYGAHLLSGLNAVTDAVRQVVLYHHERWDGDGYPEGLRGLRIPLAARIVAVADVYTSLRARRTYKPTLTRREAAAEMERMAGRELDPALTCTFLKFVGTD
ncbi:MAG TPA: HD domain-containing phosphohydrolase [Pyrinomonadaceae bacterium]|jgi:HD-GYP domain-containing protein (c-di-GMP phosphodiesterase class II)